jgi:hypothetical protein
MIRQSHPKVPKELDRICDGKHQNLGIFSGYRLHLTLTTLDTGRSCLLILWCAGHISRRPLWYGDVQRRLALLEAIQRNSPCSRTHNGQLPSEA